MSDAVYAVLAVIVCVLQIANVAAEQLDDRALQGWRDNLSLNMPFYVLETEQGVKDDSIFNPQNRLAELPQSQLEIQLRPDLFYTQGRYLASVKPRAVFTITGMDGLNEDTELDSDFYVNEAQLRMSFGRSLFLSVNREVLQWGPSMFISVSNPFFFDNGRSNPYKELGGRDFVKAIYIFDSNWTLSLIDNFDTGREPDPLNDFHKIYASKLDYVGDSFSASVILSRAENENNRLGGYSQYTVSDGLLMYAEASFSRGSSGYYPVPSTNSIGWEMAQSRANINDTQSLILGGLSYTLQSGSTIYLEYLFNEEGYTAEETARYYALGESASQAFISSAADADLAAGELFRASYPRIRMIGRNYLFVQYLWPDPYGNYDFSLRFTKNLGDNSSQWVSTFAWSVSDRTKLFALGLVNDGDEKSDFGRYQRYIAMLGVTIYIR
ncbi:MAG TPA: hypothetical protein ENI98_06955 [Gammaproteobacteria bacterium]|nr:hypothetical protein [Gammaproteobacteria bacterium]